MLAVILERDECGIHAVVIDTAKDGALWITDSYPTEREAEMAALQWVSEYLSKPAKRKPAKRRKRRTKKR